MVTGSVAGSVGKKRHHVGSSRPPRTRRRRRRAAALLLASLALPPIAGQAASFPPLTGRGGAVASDAMAATEVGLATLRRGGNAVDAAIATALALAVVFPGAGNLGGGGFAVIRLDKEIATLDFREVAPAAARADMYLDAAGKPVAEASRIGPLATGVPGSPAGLHALHERFGKLPWGEIVAPAERLAREGFTVSTPLHRSLVEKKEVLAPFPESAAVWLPGGDPLAAGATVRLPELAATLRAYGERGPRAITTGPVAAAIEASSRRHGGILAAADLAAYRPAWRPPVRFAAYGWQFAGMDLPASGGILLGETLLLLERLDWGSRPPGGADRAHLLAEAWRRAFADRFLLADPATTLARASDLLDPEWLAKRAAGIDPSRATPSGRIRPWPAASPAAEAAETTHVSAVDEKGNLVALTTTLNSIFGSGLWVPEIGFLNNEMDDFAADPGAPNQFGLVQGEANAVAPGRRMLSSMGPTILWRGGESIALGGRGGSRIPTAISLVLLHHLVDGDHLQEAIERPRIHHQWLPDRIEIEPGALSPETVAALERRGHEVAVNEKDDAKVHAVRRRADGTVEAAADPRTPGTAGVVERLPGTTAPQLTAPPAHREGGPAAGDYLQVCAPGFPLQLPEQHPLLEVQGSPF